MDWLEAVSRLRRFPKRSTVYLPGDRSETVYLLAEGRIRIGSPTPDGRLATIALIEPGEVFGELCLFQENPARENPGRDYSIGENLKPKELAKSKQLSGNRFEERAEAMLDSSIVQIPGEVIRELMASVPQLSIGVTKLVGLRRVRVERRLKSLLFRSNREKLIHLLLELAEAYGRIDEKGVRLQISLSHQEMASILGATRESITLSLKELQTEGLVQVARQKLLITNLPRLAAQVHSEIPEIEQFSRVERETSRFQLPRIVESQIGRCSE